MTAPALDPDATRLRDERDILRRRLDAFTRLLDAAERGGASVLRIDDIRNALHLPAHSQRRGAPERVITVELPGAAS